MKSCIVGAIAVGILFQAVGAKLNRHDRDDAELIAVKKNNGFLNFAKPSRSRRVEMSQVQRHSISTEASNSGWVYSNTYFTGSSCADSNIATQSGSATGVCLSIFGDSPEGNSAFYSCSGNTAQGKLYNGTTCDPNKLWQEVTVPANQCIEGTSIGDDNTDDTYLIGASQIEVFCSSGTAFPVPGAYDWAVYTEYDYSDSTCTQPMYYSAYRNKYCYGYTSTVHKYDYSYFSAYPTGYEYDDTSCQKLTYIDEFQTSCLPDSEYEENGYSVFISNTVQPVTSFVSFTSNITLTGLSTSSLNSQSQLAVVNATATSMNLPISNVGYSGSHAPTVTPAATASTKVLSVEAIATSATTFSLVATTKTSLALSSSSNANTLYSQYSTALTNAVTSQTFTQYLQTASKAYNAPGTLTATGTAVQSSAPVISNAYSNTDSSSSDNGLSAGAIAGIVIGSVVGAALIVGLIYYFVVMQGASKPPLAKAAGDVPMKANAAGEIPLA